MYLALVKRNKVLASFVRPTKNDASKYLMQDIDDLLKSLNANLVPQDIKKIVVGIGPGSYTGIRLGTTVAKMLAYFLNAKLMVVSSLFYLTSGYPSCIAYMEARNNNVFGAIYDQGKTIKKDGFFLKDELFNLANHRQIIDVENDPLIDYLKVNKKAKEIKNFVYLEPNYMRKTEAERNFEKI
jgi:tRNA threonylcarbamoyladenosine biosynthesis protein TsaB